MAQVYIGTSGFDYVEWKPSFYPQNLPRKKFLEFYTTQLNAVELNNTSYRIPTIERVAAWKAAVPDNFKLVLKAPQKITHYERLKVPSEAVGYFVKAASALGEKLGALLFQFPPSLKCDAAKLKAFLEELPVGINAVFEFRHQSWFTEETYGLLAQNKAVLCIHDSDDGITPEAVTGDLVYLRLRRSRYDEAVRVEWVEKIRRWRSEGREVYAFIKHKENPDAPLIARDFRQRV